MRFAIVLFPTLMLMLLGCSTTYYQVRDPGSGSTYYTTELDEEDGGAVRLKDARTNANVTLQNSEISKITADQYDAAIRTGSAPPVAAPMVTPSQARPPEASQD